jgi:hypothetical protein
MENTMATQISVPKQPLPATVDEFRALRIVPLRKSLLIEVEKYFLELYSNPLFQRLAEAVTPVDSVEGSPRADTQEMARMIRDEARARSDDFVGNRQLVDIAKMVNLVMKKYQMSRRERRDAYLAGTSATVQASPPTPPESATTATTETP